MTKEVCIQLKAYHGIEEAETLMESTVAGFYYERNEFYYLKYEQSLEEGGQAIPHLLKFNNNQVVITKKTSPKMVMEFVRETPTSCEYITTYGVVLLEVETKEIKLEIEGECIVLHLEYILKTKNELLSSCKMDVKITSVTDS